MSEQKTKPRNLQVAEDFAEKYGGIVIDEIKGNKGKAGYITEIDGLKQYVFLINVWHQNRKGISINREQLEKALDDNALIVMIFQGREFVCNAENWEYWARIDNNVDEHPKFGS